ncbi:Crp/Fnr family transcriptional regulator [Sphingomonas sp. FARSPH]|nr:Crp/Fnr family transcriptional regulator [Sphingomonas sp. FARSPH]
MTDPREGQFRIPVAVTGDGIRNSFLANLDPDDFALLAPHLERVPFAIGDELAQTGDPIESLHFPEGAVAAFLDSQSDGRRLAVGLIGLEGFSGWPLLLGETHWPHDVVMRAESGTALRIARDAFLACIAASDSLRDAALRFVGVINIQMASTIVSSLVHPVERRMARWILLYHDRVSGEDICLTHEEFRLMLGVRRSSITEALHRLEAEQAVRGLRGRVVVRDRAKLMDIAGDTYGPAERAYARLIATARRGDAIGDRRMGG